MWPTLCQWFPLRWNQYHVNYHNHLAWAVKKKKEKKKKRESERDLCSSCRFVAANQKSASNEPLGLRNSTGEARSGLRGFRSGVKLIWSWQFDSTPSLCCRSRHKSLLILAQGALIYPEIGYLWVVNMAVLTESCLGYTEFLLEFVLVCVCLGEGGVFKVEICVSKYHNISTSLTLNCFCQDWQLQQFFVFDSVPWHQRDWSRTKSCRRGRRKGDSKKKKELSKKEMYMFQTSTGNSRKSQPALHVKVNRRWPLVPHKLFRGFRLHPKVVELGYEIISQATCLSSLAVQLANWREWFPVWAAIQNMAVKIWTIQRLFFSQDLFFFLFFFI